MLEGNQLEKMVSIAILPRVKHYQKWMLYTRLSSSFASTTNPQFTINHDVNDEKPVRK
jgi:hypothetical protein